MKHLRLYENFQTEQEIENICSKYGITNWSINSEGLVDVDGDVNLHRKHLYKLPLRFGIVTGYFYCHNNNLTNLKGCPVKVGGDFICSNNKLVSLEGCPKEVDGGFYCSDNKLTNLEGCPKEVGGDFFCTYNQLINLKGAPKEVGGDFYCNNNILISLEGSPVYVSQNFNCANNQLTSFEGTLDFIGGHFDCRNNPIFSIWLLFIDYNKIELFNYYDIVRELDGKPAIVLARLNQFLEDIGKQPVEKVEGYINI